MKDQEFNYSGESSNIKSNRNNKKILTKRNIILLIVFVLLSAIGFTSNEDEVAVKKSIVEGTTLAELFEKAYGETQWESKDNSLFSVNGICALDGSPVKFEVVFALSDKKVKFQTLTFDGAVQSVEMASSFLQKTKELALMSTK